ncbi:MAG: hypothetical protein WD995_13910 [Gemmatimonadota bacterium]
MKNPSKSAVIPATLLLLTLASGCGADRDLGGATGSETPEPWALASAPTLHIGVVSGDETYQLHDVRDAQRLTDGRIAVANQGSREVRVYTADGQLVSASGEDGDGPGQWRALSRVHPLGEDTLLVVDHRLGRHGLVDASDGTYMGTLDSARVERVVPKTWHHRGLFLEAPADLDGPGVFGPVVEALAIESAAAPTFARLDAEGRVWVLGAPSVTPPTLRVFDLDGRERANLPLPRGFRPTQIDRAEVLGVWRDSLEVEHVRAYSIVASGPWTGPSMEAAIGRGLELEAVADADLPGLNGAFRALATAQEIHYSTQASYTTDLARLSALRDLELPTGARVDVLEASPTGWRGRMVDTTNGAGCTLSFGAFPPVEGLAAGGLSCWNARTP